MLHSVSCLMKVLCWQRTEQPGGWDHTEQAGVGIIQNRQVLGSYRTGRCWDHTEQAAVGSIQNRQVLGAYRTGRCWEHTELAGVGCIQNRQLLAAYPNLTSPNNTTHNSHARAGLTCEEQTSYSDTPPTVGIPRCTVHQEPNQHRAGIAKSIIPSK